MCLCMHTGAHLLGRQLSSSASPVEIQQHWSPLGAWVPARVVLRSAGPRTFTGSGAAGKDSSALCCVCLLIVCCNLAHKASYCFLSQKLLCGQVQWLPLAADAVIWSETASPWPKHWKKNPDRLWDQQPLLIHGIFPENACVGEHQERQSTTGDIQDPEDLTIVAINYTKVGLVKGNQSTLLEVVTVEKHCPGDLFLCSLICLPATW